MKDFFILLGLVVLFICGLKHLSIEKVYHNCTWTVTSLSRTGDGYDIYAVKCIHGYTDTETDFSYSHSENDTIFGSMLVEKDKMKENP